MTHDVRDMTGVDLSIDPDASTYVSTQVPVAVDFATAAGVLETLEGPVHYVAGDALLTGEANDRWPVGRARFDSVYQSEGRPGLYRKRATRVFARRVDEPFSVRINGGADVLGGKPGDWLVQHEPGHYGIVARELFDSRYRRGS